MALAKNLTVSAINIDLVNSIVTIVTTITATDDSGGTPEVFARGLDSAQYRQADKAALAAELPGLGTAIAAKLGW